MKKILRVLMIVSLVLSMFAISVSAEEVSTPENPIDIDEIQSMQEKMSEYDVIELSYITLLTSYSFLHL